MIQEVRKLPRIFLKNISKVVREFWNSTLFQIGFVWIIRTAGETISEHFKILDEIWESCTNNSGNWYASTFFWIISENCVNENNSFVI